MLPFIFIISSLRLYLRLYRLSLNQSDHYHQRSHQVATITPRRRCPPWTYRCQETTTPNTPPNLEKANHQHVNQSMRLGLPELPSNHLQSLHLAVPSLAAVPILAANPARWGNIVPASTTTASLARSPAASLLRRAAPRPAPVSQRRTTGVRSMSLMREDAFRIDLPRESSVCHMNRCLQPFSKSPMTNIMQVRRPRTRKRVEIETWRISYELDIPTQHLLPRTCKAVTICLDFHGEDQA